MKSPAILAAAPLALNLALQPARAAETIVVVPDNFNESADAEAVINGIAPMLEAMASGDRLQVIDAATGSRIMDVTLPEDPAYARHPQLKLNALRPEYEKAASFLAGTRRPDAQPIDGESAEQVFVPQTLAELGHEANEGARVILVLNPVYHNPTVPGASMKAAIPSDGLILADASASPFGTAGMQDRLAGVEVYFCVSEQADFVNPGHRRDVQRVNMLMAEQFGAHPAAYTTNLDECFALAAAGDTSGAENLGLAPLDPEAEARMIPVDSMLPDLPLDVAVLPSCGVADLDADMTREEDALPPDLEKEIEQGRMAMVEIEVMDSDEVDGDAVEFIGADFVKRVDLTDQPQTIRVPVSAGRLKVRAVQDGRGGVTVAVRLPSGRVLLSREMIVGEEAIIDLASS